MHAASPILFPGGQARFVSGSELRGNASWRKAFEAQAKDSRFYEVVEQTLACSFEHHYLILENTVGETRAIQPVFFVQQNLLEGLPALQPVVDPVRRVFPRLFTMRVLMVGCAAGEGHLGVCRADDMEWAVAAMHSTLPIFARHGKASLVVFKDFRSDYRATLQSLVQEEFTRVPSMPMTRLSLRHANFETYLNTLSKATRKDLRRKFRRTAKSAPIELEVLNDVAPQVDEIYPLYLQVHERSALKFECLTKAYFRELGRRMPDRVRFFLWRQEGKVIAFSLGLVHAGTFYDDYLGLDYRVALDLHLYFYTFRDIISWAIAQGLENYCSSPLNYEPKLHLGCELAALDLYVMHTSPWLNPIFRRAVKLLEPTRHNPVLQRFPNARALQ
ncbi:MAG: GNAT family N-acetyltransferase [Chthoniobacterales bacterium]|nr:GNAT family N-acetyltransferase [Chthoniobacterales bacterium]